jgi:hypothetical protein
MSARQSSGALPSRGACRHREQHRGVGDRGRRWAQPTWGPFWDHTLCAMVNDLRVCARHARPPQASKLRDLGKRVTATDWGSSGLPSFNVTEPRYDVPGCCPRWASIVLNGGSVAVKATPLRGRPEAEP